ncbi:BamA/TamA family outer membrane protein, partial [Bartonella sp. AA86SXKL]
ADVATLYGSNYKPVFQGETPVTNIKSAWRSSAGVSLMWDSPFGPLRFDYAWPIKKQEGDRLQQLNFGISTKF